MMTPIGSKIMALWMFYKVMFYGYLFLSYLTTYNVDAWKYGAEQNIWTEGLEIRSWMNINKEQIHFTELFGVTGLVKCGYTWEDGTGMGDTEWDCGGGVQDYTRANVGLLWAR